MSNKKSKTREYLKTTVDRPIIVYDSEHSQGNWYVRIQVNTDHHRQPVQGGPVNFDYRSTTNIELPINGPGLNKATRKVKGLLQRLGLPEPLLPLKPYNRTIPIYKEHKKSTRPLYIE